MSIDPLILSTYLPACRSSYLADPVAPPGYIKVSDIQSSGFSSELTKWFGSARFHGMVCISVDKLTALVAIRGSATLFDWIEDILAAPIWTSGGLVHPGFWFIFNMLKDSIRAGLANLSAPNLVVTGHSLGGAVAVHVAKAFRVEGHTKVCTFAAPRVADYNYCFNYNRSVLDHTRVVNTGDIVPHVLLRPLYEDVGKALAINAGTSLLDPVKAHILDTYKIGIRKLV